MEQDIMRKLEELEAKVEEVRVSAEKMRRYFLWTLYITVALFILPLIGIAFVVPSFINTYTTNLDSIGLYN